MIKRTFDVFLSLIALLVASPFLIGAAICIRLESPGPILVTRVRVGQHLRPFALWKFRTTYQNDKNGEFQTTKTGRFLRKYKLDNIPQLINVLKGEMSLIGPHPEEISVVEAFQDSFSMLLKHKPGLTDLATLKFLETPPRLRFQVNPEKIFRNKILHEKILLSSFYLRRSSLLLDLAIICETVLRICGSRYSFFVMPGETRKRALGSSSRFSLDRYPYMNSSPTSHQLSFLQGNGFSLGKLAIDMFCGALSFGVAFAFSIGLYYWYVPSITLDRALLETYLSVAFFQGLIFVGVWLITLVSLGIYAKKTKNAFRWKPLKILTAICLAPVLWFAIPFEQLSQHYLAIRQGTALGLPLFLGLLIGGPRLVKHYIFNRMVVEIHHHRKQEVKSVLIIGGGGYIGSQLCRDLLEQGYHVRILDTFLFGDFSVRDLYSNPAFEVMMGDFRNIDTVMQAIRGADAVVHLGGLVGDPACAVDDEQTLEINLTATLMIAEICKSLKIERLVFASSCSVYGAGEKEVLTEKSPLNPVSLYARTKIASEQVLLDLTNEEFAPTILRFSTLFGLSPRPRFDLVVNLLTARAVKEGKMTISGGANWRPFVHVKDISKTILTVLEAPLNKVRGEIFNVGSDRNNFTIMDVGKKIAELVPGSKIETIEDVTDRRDYNVSFKKIRETLGLDLSISLEEGILEIKEAFSRGTLKEYSSSVYSNLKQTQKVFDEFNSSEEKTPEVTIHPLTGQLRKTVKTILGETSQLS